MKFLFLVVMIGMILVTGVHAANTSSELQNTSKSQVMVYMVGSDLESEGNSGTTNIQQMIKGYGNSSPEDLQILVGYGGAKKEGWKGLTIATIEDLIKDNKNGIIGDEGIYEFTDPSIDMGSGEGLSSFISWCSNHYKGEHTYLIFWNHGSGYDGFGVDENTENMASLSNITQAMHDTSFKADVIGFDACLMGGIEVASALAPYANYLVASEELEPGAGWAYHLWIPVIVKNPEQDPVTTGKKIVDSYVDTESDPGRTLSVIKLDEINPLIQGLDHLGQNASLTLSSENGIRTLGKAYGNVTRFGQTPEDNSAVSVDLPLLVDSLTRALPESAHSGEEVKTALKKAVVYERHDSYIPDANGISIMDPRGMNITVYNTKGDVVTLSSGWDSFIKELLAKQQTDTEKPHFNRTGNNTYELTDPSGTATVWTQYFTYNNETDELLQLGAEPMDQSDQYSVPDWDGSWYYLHDSGDKEKTALVEMYYEDKTPEGLKKYSSEVNITQNGTPRLAVMYSYLDPDGETKLDFTPYTLREDGDVLFSRSPLVPTDGDLIETFASVVTDNPEPKWVKIGSLPVSGTPVLTKDTLPDGTYMAGLYADYGNGYGDYTDLEKIVITDGKVTHEGTFTPSLS